MAPTPKQIRSAILDLLRDRPMTGPELAGRMNVPWSYVRSNLGVLSRRNQIVKSSDDRWHPTDE